MAAATGRRLSAGVIARRFVLTLVAIVTLIVDGNMVHPDVRAVAYEVS